MSHFELPRPVAAALDRGPVRFMVLGTSAFIQAGVKGGEPVFTGQNYVRGIWPGDMTQHTYRARGMLADARAGDTITVTAADVADFS